jgi:hypothetical protein
MRLQPASGNRTNRGILLIAYHFPPSAAVGGVRMTNLANGLRSLGWEPHVLTIRGRDIERLDRERLRGVEGIPVHRAAVLPTVERIYEWMRKRPAQERAVTPAPGVSSFPPVAREKLSRRLRRYVLSFTALPDRERGWVLPASLAAIRQVRRRRIRWIMTSCPPYSAHLVGLMVTWTSPVRWVADFRDPWMTTGSKRLYPTSAASRRIESWLERKVVERADLVAFSVDRLGAAYRERYLQAAPDKFVHVPNGVTRRQPSGGASRAKYDPFTLSYTGSLYLGRSPEPVCQAVSRLINEGRITSADVRIKLVGHCRGVDGATTASLVRKYGLESVVEVQDPVSYEQAQEIISRSHLALLFAPNQTYQIPAKAYDYLAAGTRILAIAGESATADLVKETSSGEAFAPDDVEGIARFIGREMQRRASSNGGARTSLTRFAIERVAGDLVAHMERVEGTSRSGSGA